MDQNEAKKTCRKSVRQVFISIYDIFQRNVRKVLILKRILHKYCIFIVTMIYFLRNKHDIIVIIPRFLVVTFLLINSRAKEDSLCRKYSNPAV